MLSRFVTAVAMLALASFAFPQQGSVVSVVADKHQMTVKVGETEHTVDARKVELLDAQGKTAKLSDFAAKDKIDVTMQEQRITKIQKLAAQGQHLASTLGLSQGAVVRVDLEAKQITIKVDGVETTVSAASVKLLNREGKPATLSDFAAGAKIEVTKDDAGLITKIQSIG